MAALLSRHWTSLEPLSDESVGGEKMLRLRKDIPLFIEGKKKAFTVSYDDGVTQDEKFIALLDYYGIKGTFNLNAGLMGEKDWLNQPGISVSHYKFEREEAAWIYKNHEIAIHTMTHPDLSKVSETMIAYETVACKKELEELVQKPVRGMAYPFGTYNQTVKEVLKKCGISYARTVESTHAFDLPKDFLVWHPTCHHTEKCLEELGKRFLESRSTEMELFYLWGHSYEFDAYKEWKRIERFFEKMAGNEEIWYATNIEIVDYLEAVRKLLYSSTGDYISNPSSIDVWMEIDGEIYCIRSGETAIIKKK